MGVTTLAESPSLVKLYAKAALGGPLHRGGELPESSYELAPRAVDVEHLARYDRVCGLHFDDVLPGTYLHVLAFPLQIALMSERAFPFPLVGLVHVANSITVHRSVSTTEQIALLVRADSLRDHPAGRQFDLLSQASVGGQPVWSGRSTYLRRGGGGSATREPRATSAQPISGGARVRVPADIGRRYAAVSGDRNPIHLHPLTAKAFGFPAAIAHGMWLAARTLATLEGRLPDSYTFDVAFKTPVLLPSTVAVRAEPAPGGWALDVRNTGTDKPHLTGFAGRRPD